MHHSLDYCLQTHLQRTVQWIGFSLIDFTLPGRSLAKPACTECRECWMAHENWCHRKDVNYSCGCFWLIGRACEREIKQYVLWLTRTRRTRSFKRCNVCSVIRCITAYILHRPVAGHHTLWRKVSTSLECKGFAKKL